MKSDMIIDIFRPECCSIMPKKRVDLFSLFGKKWHYASKGRYALYHILKQAGITGKMLIPVYVCETVLIPLRILHIEPVFYDINPDDLNADVDSLEKLGKLHSVSSVLVVSMYGNPADYYRIERICKQNNWFMIDDAAQAMGAEVDGKPVGTFGDAGFYSFSPGKPTAGPMGAFYWTSSEAGAELHESHDWVHRIIYNDFIINRVKIYDDISWVKRKISSFLVRFCNKFIDIKNDRISPCEEEFLGNIYESSMGEYRQKKREILEHIINLKIPGIRFLQTCRGLANSYKLVMIADDLAIAHRMISYLKDKKIYASNGYKMLVGDLANLPNALDLDKCIVEVPIECNNKKTDYLIKCLNDLV